MTNCEHFIIPNTTFGWWAAWLVEKEGSTVIAQKQWTGNDIMLSNPKVPSRWTKINNTFEQHKDKKRTLFM